MIFPRSQLSVHAEERLRESFRVQPADLLATLNAGLGERIGASRKRSHLSHRLVWSHVDEIPIVVIQDVIGGTVVTVLPVDIYRREYSNNLTEQRLRRVINQMVHSGLAPNDRWEPGDRLEAVTAHAVFRNSPKPVALGK